MKLIGSLYRGAVLAAVALVPLQAAALEIQGPARLVLGDGSAAELSAVGVRGRPLRWFANVGDIQPADPSDGADRVRYLPPASLHPQVALVVAATEDWSELALHPIVLAGRPTVRFSFERRSTVTVTVDGETFGPVRTDRSGRGELELVVPAGVTEAVAVAEDRLGNTRQQTIRLDPPPTPRTFLLCPDAGGPAWLFAVSHDGQKASITDTPEVLDPSGTPIAMRPVGEGIFQVPITAQSSTNGPRYLLSASIGSEDPPSHCSMSLPPPEPMADGQGDADPNAGGDDVPPLALALEAHVGWLSNFGKVSGPVARISVLAEIPLETNVNLSAGAAVGYWGGSDSGMDASQLEAVDVSVDALPLLLQFGGHIAIGVLHLYARSLAGLVIGWTSVASPSTGEATSVDAAWLLGGTLAAGPELGPGVLAGELGFFYAPLTGSVRGNLGGFLVSLSYRVTL